MSTGTESKIQTIAKALASYLAQQSFTFAVSEFVVGSFVTEDIEDHGNEPKVYVEASGSVQELEDTIAATRESRMLVFSLTVQIVDVIQFGSQVELADLSKLSEEIRAAINRVPQAGAEYWSLNAEQPVEDFQQSELEEHAYYRQIFTVEYIDIE